MTLLKSIVLCLALANAGYFLWAAGIAKTPESHTQMPPAATLKLASESLPAERTASTGADAPTGRHRASPTPPKAKAQGRICLPM